MRFWNRRGFLGILGAGAALWSLSGKAEAALFFLKKLLGRPPRETLPVTPNRDFYVYHYGESAYLLTKDLDVLRWVLEITGKVNQPLSLTYGELMQRPAIIQIATIECVENPIGGESIGNAVWRGVPLGPLLEQAGILRGSEDIVFKGLDGYSDSIPVDRALTGNVLLAYEMNGVVLPREHGFPLRAVVPGIYGMKNVKWIGEIEVVDYDYKGYWQQRGWSDTAPVKLTSRIDFPGNYQELSIGTHTIRGIAFSGDKGIQSVEVSTDGGMAWNEAPLRERMSPYSWVLWNFNWTTRRPGVYRVVVRARDQQGHLQESKPSQAFPSGPTGLDSIVVHVVEKGKKG